MEGPAAQRWRLLCDSAVQCSAVKCSAVQCSAVQCSAVQCSAGEYLCAPAGAANASVSVLVTVRQTRSFFDSGAARAGAAGRLLLLPGALLLRRLARP
jgi:hypothetical protein